MRSARAAMFSLFLLAGCGARSGLFVSGAGAPGSASTDAGPVPSPDNGCTSAVSGATPMRGYCSTRAHLAPHAAPTAPVAGWELQLPTDHEPSEMVVDDAGNIFATIAHDQHEVLVQVDAKGALVVQHDLGDRALRSLYVASDGTLHGVIAGPPPMLISMAPNGPVEKIAPLPDNATRFAVASDGSLVAIETDYHSPDRVVHIARDGTELWTSPALDDGSCGGCISDPALFDHDAVIVATYTLKGGTTLRCLDDQGAIAWQRHIDGILTEGPAVASDGSLRLVTGVSGAAGPVTWVSAVSADGAPLWRTELDADYQQTGDDALVIATDGATFVHTFTALFAVGPAGKIRWRVDAPTNLSYDAVVDAHGVLVGLLGAVRGLDAATGAERWHIDGPGISGKTYYYLSNVALGPNRCLVGANHGGRLFSACDP